MNIAVPIIISVVAMTIIIAVRYYVSSGFFAWLTRLKFPRYHNDLQKQIMNEKYYSFLSAFIYGAPAGIIAWGWDNLGWTLVYTDIEQYPLYYVPLSIFIYLFVHDSWFYWTHRWMHIPKYFKLTHRVHHDSSPPTAWAAMNFHPLEALTGAIFLPTIVFIVPIHVYALGLVLFIMTFMGITNHMGWEIFPRTIVHGRLGRYLITATHHQKHHDDYRGNYGLYFRFWDKICGTDIGHGRFQH